MKAMERCHPAVLTVYILAVAGITMCSLHPVVLVLSLFGSILTFCLCGGRSHGYFLGLFLLLALLNPLVSHSGTTVLFVLNHNPVTLEAALYGLVSAMGVLAVIYWFRTFSTIMTSDKLLYVFGLLSPKLSLVLSMAIRYAGLFRRQAQKTTEAQRALGLYREDNLLDSFRGGVRIFSILLTWALENGITTADSMAARGYGCGRRTHFSRFRLRRTDIVFLLLTLLCTTLCGVGMVMGTWDIRFYPTITTAPASVGGILSLTGFGLLVSLPTLFHCKEALQWHYSAWTD